MVSRSTFSCAAATRATATPNTNRRSVRSIGFFLDYQAATYFCNSPAGGPTHGAGDEFAVPGILVGLAPMAQLDVDDTRLLPRPDPGQRPVAGGMVGGEQDLQAGGAPHALVGFVVDVDRGQTLDNGMAAHGRHVDVLVVQVSGGLGGRLFCQQVAPADDLAPPPRPVLEVGDGMMQHDQALAGLQERLQVLALGLGDVLNE